MANWYHNEPYAENYQQATYNGFPFLPEYGPRRHAPREEPFITQSRGHKGWYQGDLRLPSSFKSKKYFVRPIDGARRGTLGRLRDGLTGQGPDVFVVAKGDARTLHREVPGRERWSNWDKTGLHWPRHGDRDAGEDMDWYPKRNMRSMPWAKREKGEVYNFRTRHFEELRGSNRRDFWSDAHW
jgi:hypothetical protein